MWTHHSPVGGPPLTLRPQAGQVQHQTVKRRRMLPHPLPMGCNYPSLWIVTATASLRMHQPEMTRPSDELRFSAGYRGSKFLMRRPDQKRRSRHLPPVPIRGATFCAGPAVFVREANAFSSSSKAPRSGSSMLELETGILETILKGTRRT